jgi:hypothetical protein
MRFIEQWLYLSPDNGSGVAEVAVATVALLALVVTSRYITTKAMDGHLTMQVLANKFATCKPN